MGSSYAMVRRAILKDPSHHKMGLRYLLRNGLTEEVWFHRSGMLQGKGKMWKWYVVVKTNLK